MIIKTEGYCIPPFLNVWEEKEINNMKIFVHDICKNFLRNFERISKQEDITTAVIETFFSLGYTASDIDISVINENGRTFISNYVLDDKCDLILCCVMSYKDSKVTSLALEASAFGFKELFSIDFLTKDFKAEQKTHTDQLIKSWSTKENFYDSDII